MFHYTFTAQETESYQERNRKNMLLLGGVSLMVVLSSGLQGGWLLGLILGAIVFTILYLAIGRWENLFITSISIQENEVEIRYKNKNEELVLKGPIKDFSFRKALALNYIRTPYLEIKYKNKLNIKQLIVGTWSEDEFDRLITSLESQINI